MLEKPPEGELIVINNIKYNLEQAEAADLVDVIRDKNGNVTRCTVKTEAVPRNLQESTTLSDGTVITQN